MTSPLHSYADTGLGPLEEEERRKRRGERERGGEARREGKREEQNGNWEGEMQREKG